MKNKNVFAEGNLNTLINTFNINIYKRNIYILIIFSLWNYFALLWTL